MTSNTIKNNIEKIDDYLKEKNDFVSLTQISKDLKVHYRSVKKCIKILEKFNRVEIVTNGRITFVKFKTEDNKQEDNTKI
jgi:Mn-dependent DtxR family transcriptional regulator